MNKKALLIVAGFIVLIGGWYAFRPERLFINETVNESFPGAAAETGFAKAIVRGDFHSASHGTKGVATIYEVNGKNVLRLTNFETSNGPDVQVYLGLAQDANDDETVTRAGFYHLAALKGNQGDQNYDIPADVDVTKYKSVTIWCRRFGKNFGTAPLVNADMVGATMPDLLESGSFHGVSHDTRGTASIYEIDGKKVLRFTNFETSNGPDVQVYLGVAQDANDDETVTKSGFYHLAALKGNKGDQNYEIPANVDCSKYRSVTIWCMRFGKNFGTAPLSPALPGRAAM